MTTSNSIIDVAVVLDTRLQKIKLTLRFELVNMTLVPILVPRTRCSEPNMIPVKITRLFQTTSHRA